MAPPFGTTLAEGSNLTKIVGTLLALFSTNFLSLSPTFLHCRKLITNYNVLFVWVSTSTALITTFTVLVGLCMLAVPSRATPQT